MRGFVLVAAAALITTACGNSTGPTPLPPTEDPPKIVCPAPLTIQLVSGSSIAVTYPGPTTVNGKPPVATACAPVSGSLFNVGATSVACIATDALQRTDVCSFTVTVLAPVPPPVLAVTTFFAFGDSITWGDDGRNSASDPLGRLFPRVQLPDPQTYPSVLQQSLRDRYKAQLPAVKNEGKPGESVTDSGTFPRFVALTSGRKYEAVLIMEGTNDLQKAHNAADAASREGILGSAAAGLRQMVGDAKQHGLRPLLATIPPMNPSGSRGAVYGAELVSSFNNRIRSVAAAENITLVDVNLAFGGNLALLGSDGVHPNADGYNTIAGAFFDGIRRTLETKTSFAPSIRHR